MNNIYLIHLKSGSIVKVKTTKTLVPTAQDLDGIVIVGESSFIQSEIAAIEKIKESTPKAEFIEGSLLGSGGKFSIGTGIEKISVKFKNDDELSEFLSNVSTGILQKALDIQFKKNHE